MKHEYHCEIRIASENDISSELARAMFSRHVRQVVTSAIIIKNRMFSSALLHSPRTVVYINGVVRNMCIIFLIIYQASS